MALIDLKLISKLAAQGEQQRFTIESLAFNADAHKRGNDDALIGFLFKGSLQTDNLFKGLQKLHQVCTDLAADNVQPYSDILEAYQEEVDEEDRTAFSPFNELSYCFHMGTVHDLPKQIEQYGELLAMAAQYGEVQKKMREGFKKFFPTVSLGYLANDENGEPMIIPQSEIPPQLVNEIETNREIKEVDVEYCLDGYNTFYQTCRDIMDAYWPTENYVRCAQEILALFAPYQATLTLSPE